MRPKNELLYLCMSHQIVDDDTSVIMMVQYLQRRHQTLSGLMHDVGCISGVCVTLFLHWIACFAGDGKWITEVVCERLQETLPHGYLDIAWVRTSEGVDRLHG
jgi:hypothetical protein